MSAITNIQELISEKDEALVMAIQELTRHRDDVCTEGHCEQESNYHWRGCPTMINPIITALRKAWEAK